MDIRKISDLKKEDLQGKKVFVRMDFDVPAGDLTRIEASIDTVKYLLENDAKLLLIGHRGRPAGIKSEELSLVNLMESLKKFVGRKITFVPDFEHPELVAGGDIYLFENLRFYKEEEENQKEFSKKMSLMGEIYVNECFSTSHRRHASFVGITEFLPSYAGFRLSKEISELSDVIENPVRPLIFIISGLKEDKIEMVKKIKEFADKVLVGGKLPEYIEKNKECEFLMNYPKLIIAKLNPDREDITIHSIEKFEEEINIAGTIVLAGVPGKFEDPDQRLGTKRVFEKVSKSIAHKIAGGGDTEAVLKSLNLIDKFDWISVGGGAMLNFLAGEKLPGIEVLKIK